jgi:hypothetical protein
VDIFDTVFQGDPFFEGFNRDAISFDAQKDNPAGTHLNGILGLNDFPKEEIRQEFARSSVINSGLSTGGIELHLRFWECYRHILNTRNDSVLERLLYPDEDVVYYIIRSNAILSAQIPIRLMGPEDYFHLAWRESVRRGVVNEIGEYKMPNTELYPLVIHQADRSRNLTWSIVRACPQVFPQVEPYLRGL